MVYEIYPSGSDQYSKNTTYNKYAIVGGREERHIEFRRYFLRSTVTSIRGNVFVSISLANKDSLLSAWWPYFHFFFSKIYLYRVNVYLITYFYLFAFFIILHLLLLFTYLLVEAYTVVLHAVATLRECHLWHHTKLKFGFNQPINKSINHKWHPNANHSL